MTENKLWDLIESLDWTIDNDYRRIEGELMMMPRETSNLIREFVDKKQSELYNKFEDDWLGEPGIEVSDDGWSDLTAEVIGRGKKFYENITVKKLQLMAINNTYHENFTYSFQFLYE